MALRKDPTVKRRFRRRTVRVLVDYAAAGEVHCEYATTLGAGGLFIESESPLPEGTHLKVRFRLGGAAGEGAVHEIEGRVVWTQAPTEGETQRAPGMGISFTDAVATAALARELEST